MLKLNAFKNYIITYINHFSIYDYVAYAWLILLFFIAILLAILIAKKSPIFSMLIFFVALILLFVGPFIIKNYLDEYLRPTKNIDILVKKLEFSNALVVTGKVKNISNHTYNICNVKISVLKNSDNFINKTINKLKPLRKKSISINESLDINQTKELRVVFDNYTYANDVNVSINSECY